MKPGEERILKELLFEQIYSLTENTIRDLKHVRISESQEFMHIYCRFACPSFLRFYEEDPVNVLECFKKAFVIKERLIEKGKIIYKHETAGSLLPPFNFWRPGWDDLHFRAAEDVLLPIIMGTRAMIIDFYCILNFGCTVRGLVKKARAIDSESALKLIKLDPCLMTEKFLDRVYRLILLDPRLRIKLMRALERDPQFWKVDSRKRMLFAAKVLWLIEYPGGYDAWFDFLGSKNINHYGNPRTFERACRTHGIIKGYPKERKRPD